jgi:hypothetical protein
MNPEQEWDQIRSQRASAFGVAGMGVLRVTLLFGSIAVALALFIAPLAGNYTRTQFSDASGLDMTRTGSIGQRNVYTLRRSVLQPSPDSVCMIRANGVRRGDC